MDRQEKGFTLVELMITVVIVAIGVAIALPSWKHMVEKREVTAAAEEIVALMNFAQSEAIKRNQETTVSWNSTGGHNKNWCIGVTLGATACDCTETNTAAGDFCDIDDVPYRLVQTSFADIDDEFLHTNSSLLSTSFSYDPIRGILTNVPAALATEIAAGDYLYYLHNDSKVDGSRWYELQIRINMVGRVSVCTDDGRRSFIGAYPEC
jgi:type IV fimbrial biogenesis protein FimT